VIEWRARDLEEALGICRDLGNRRGPGNALIFLRIARRATRDYPAAAGDLEETLGICGDLGDRGGEAEALNEAGTPHRVAGDLRQAGACHQQALDLTRQIGSSWDEATRWPAGADAPRLPAAPPRHKTSCGRRWRSSSGSGRPRPPRFPANWAP
jgi:hypothetical protein